jgi:cytidylate kinase
MSKVIAIDGPAGSGKGTITSLIAKRLNLVTIDTGATYRAIALAALQNNLTLEDEDKIIELSKTSKVNFDENGHTFLNDEDVSDKIRSKEVTAIVSKLSSIIEVRKNLVKLQRKLAEGKDVIMEGRDITTVVFPDADYKFYLDASLEERVNRRLKQNQENNIDMSYDEIKESISARDYNDMHKEYGALTRTDEQIYIDTTNMTIDEVVDKIVGIIEGD